jgi:hypothetical protein
MSIISSLLLPYLILFLVSLPFDIHTDKGQTMDDSGICEPCAQAWWEESNVQGNVRLNRGQGKR